MDFATHIASRGSIDHHAENSGARCCYTRRIMFGDEARHFHIVKVPPGGRAAARWPLTRTPQSASVFLLRMGLT